MSEKEVAFLPFHALNDFMLPDFRRQVVRSTLTALPSLQKPIRGSIEKQIRKNVRVPGFRNSAKAPVSVQVAPMIKAFEKHPDLVAAVLAGWAETLPELRSQVYELLRQRDWEILPLDANRTRLPGFLTRWPAGEDFETLNQAFAESYPDSNAASDDVSLMTVWLSGRLPVDVQDGEGDAERQD